MFFGQEVKLNQQKASAVTMETDIKLSQAVLDPATKGNKKEPVCLVAEIQGKSFILAVIDPNHSWQCPLDLMIAAGTEVKFYLRGQGTIHLTGYEFPEDDGDDFDMSLSDDEDYELDEEDDSLSEADEEVAKMAPKKKVKAGTKGSSPAAPAAITNGKGSASKSNGKSAPGGGRPSLEGGDVGMDDSDLDMDDSDDDDDADLDESDDDLDSEDDDDLSASDEEDGVTDDSDDDEDF